MTIYLKTGEKLLINNEKENITCCYHKSTPIITIKRKEGDYEISLYVIPTDNVSYIDWGNN